MTRSMKRDEGMTLIETLLVLAVLSLMISIPTVQFSRLKERSETALFFETFQSSVTLMQNYAILNDKWTVIEFRRPLKDISFRVAGERGHPIEHKLSLPDHISLLNDLTEFRFSRGTGHISGHEVIRFRTPEGIVEFAFQLGSGRYEIR